MPTFQTRAGLKIHYTCEGTEGPVLILLHGLGSSTAFWRPQTAAFSEEYRLILPDFPGHGESEDIRLHGIERYTDILAELLDGLGITEVSIMALSAGCSVALLYAIRHPGRVKSLVLQGPMGGITPPWLPWSWPKYLLITLYLLSALVSFLLLGKARTAWLINKIPAQTKVFNPLLYRIERQVSPWAVLFITLQMMYPPHIGKLHRVTAPVLVIVGEEDPSPHRYYRHVADHVSGPAEYREIPGSRHAVSLDNPALYNTLCLEWLRRNRQTQPEPEE